MCLDLRELRWLEDGFHCPNINGNNGNDDTDEEERGKLVHIFYSYKHHNSHETEADAAINSHVVQHSAVLSMDISSIKYGCLRDQIFLWMSEQIII